MRHPLIILFLAFIFGLAACSDDPPANLPPEGDWPENWIGGVCGALFGLPGPNSGLGEGHCQPSCNCNGQDFEEPIYTKEDLDNLRARVLLNEYEELAYDPYEDKDQYGNTETTEVCGVQNDDSVPGGYRLITYPDDATAAAAGAQVTHYGPCGFCSSFQDLLVYIEKPDLTNPVRQCGLEGFSKGEEHQRNCLAELGFSPPCVDIWYYNTQHTKNVCGTLCLPRLNAPHHLKDGRLNPCIQCDEDKSGPVFKAISGRTRRNSGLAAGLCRPCDQVSPLVHRYSE